MKTVYLGKSMDKPKLKRFIMNKEKFQLKENLTDFLYLNLQQNLIFTIQTYHTAQSNVQQSPLLEEYFTLFDLNFI